MKRSEKEQLQNLREALESGALTDQPCWSFIKELNSYSAERLDSVAIRDGYRHYTYRQMFRYWERYAETFSALNITGKNRSRAALIGTPLTESVFAFYGLNMTGASVSLIYPFDLFDEKQIHSMIEREQITDLLVSELYAFPQLMKRLLRDREMLGLRNIIVLESPMGGEYGIPGLEMIRNLNKALFRELPGALLMEDLLKEYEATSIAYGKGKSSDTSVILHTTGTVSGMHKPVPMSDKAMNSFVASAIKAKETYKEFQNAPDHMVSCLTLNMSWVYAMVDMLHAALGLGMEVVCLPVGGSNPRYADAIEHYGTSILFTSKSILDSWLKTMPDIDLSKLKIVFMGGTYVSPEYKKQFNDYLRSCGSSARIINGYGLSELGGACFLAPSTREDDAIGYPLPGFKAKVFVEEENRYYDISEGPRTGILFISSPTMSTGRLGNTVFFTLERIGDEDYFNTNDLVRVNEDGSLTCIGRSNQFFVNNEGVRFDAGLVENSVTAQPGIVACGLAPEMHKTLHDNIPVLYVEMMEQGTGALSVLRKALIQVFLHDGMLAETNMPSQCVITEKVPLNSSGKVDAKKLASGTVTGQRYSVKPVKVNGELVDILMVPAAEGEHATMGAGIPEELEGDPYNILSELFAVIPDLNEGKFTKLFRIPGLRELVIKLTGFDIKDIPGSMRDSAPKMFSMAYRKYLTPFMKGDFLMSKKKKKMMKNFASMWQGMMPPMPRMPFMPGADWFGGDKEDMGLPMGDFMPGMKSFWEQTIEMQKSSIDGSRDQWKQFFNYMMEMHENFEEFMPEELPAMPGMPFAQMFPMSPKSFAKKMKEFQEMANEHFMEQADSMTDFFIKGQKKACEMFPQKKESGEEAEKESEPAGDAEGEEKAEAAEAEVKEEKTEAEAAE